MRGCQIVAKVPRGERPPRPMEGDRTMPEGVWSLANDCWKESPSGRPSIMEVEQRMLHIVQIG